MKQFILFFAIAACSVAGQISNEYLPPVDNALVSPSNEYLPPVEDEPAHILADDGYRYKTVRRLKYRHRRDVNELPSNEYLPPVEESHFAAVPTQEYLPPVSAAVGQENILADDGYRYKTVRRLKYRHRRDVNELPSNEYLPPVEESHFAAVPTQEYLPPVSAAVGQENILANDGYRYKTVRRLKYRHRRDVNELPSNEYLPPVEESHFADVPTQEYLPPVSAAVGQENILADDGYRYKTVRRLKYRHRRDVNELPSNEYLPPVEESHFAAVPTQEYLPPVSAAVGQENILADDGYRYKTVRRLKYRHRRDVNELPSNEYLPPVEESHFAAVPTQEYLPPVSAAVGQENILADDGYRYKTVRRLKYRHRRDVNELPSNEYLPPVEESHFAAVPTQEYLPPVSAAVGQENILADDGYRYKTVRRLKYRHRRDVNELPSNEYLPPVEESHFAAVPTQEYLPPVSAAVGQENILADDGYRYKTVRRLKYRHRRDVNELPSNEYLPPVEESHFAAVPTQEYLPPVSAAVGQENILADDGYRYKTVRRLKYRHRRDVNELPSNEYLPPVQELSAAIAPTQEYLPPVSGAFEQQNILADDGYRYKVVRKLKYRRH